MAQLHVRGGKRLREIDSAAHCGAGDAYFRLDWVPSGGVDVELTGAHGAPVWTLQRRVGGQSFQTLSPDLIRIPPAGLPDRIAVNCAVDGQRLTVVIWFVSGRVTVRTHGRIDLAHANQAWRRSVRELGLGIRVDPIEGNEDLVSIIRARQRLCLTTFAAKKARARGLWCDEGAARDRMLTMATALDHDAPMPAPRRVALPLLQAGRAGDNWVAFMSALGERDGDEAELGAVFGERLFVSRQMFTDHKTGASKMDKRGRAAFMLYLAEAILQPDEAWLRTGSLGDATLVLLARFIRGIDVFGMVAVFKERPAGWEGWTGYNAPRLIYVQEKRDGVLIYRRPET